MGKFMVRNVTIDPTTCEKLGGLCEALALQDEEGRLLGVFRPTSDLLVREMETELTEAELQRREREPGVPTADVLKLLDGLSSQ